jgi:hypothetical protein
MRTEQAIRQIDSLMKSKGWAYVKEVMQEEILHAAYQLGNNPEMSSKEIDFRLGAMWASRKLLELPDKLMLKLEAEIALTATAEKENP